jgi:hypothetical protein
MVAVVGSSAGSTSASLTYTHRDEYSATATLAYRDERRATLALAYTHCDQYPTTFTYAHRAKHSSEQIPGSAAGRGKVMRHKIAAS